MRYLLTDPRGVLPIQDVSPPSAWNRWLCADCGTFRVSARSKAALDAAMADHRAFVHLQVGSAVSQDRRTS